MDRIHGPVLFIDRSDINTDEIIPAKHLTEISKTALKPHLFEDLHIDDLDYVRQRIDDAVIVVTRDNFGCGSSREHAPWALQVNGIQAVIAPGFARIFRQNMFNCGMIALELPADDIDALFTRYGPADSVTGEIDLDAHRFTCRDTAGQHLCLPFSLNAFDEALVTAGGWVEYADQHY